MPSVGELSMRMSADSRGLVSGFSTASQSLQSFDARASATSAASEQLSKNFEKIGKAVKSIGAVALAFRELSGEGGGEISKITNKVQELALSLSIFGGPLARLVGLGAVGVGEAVKFLDRTFNDLSETEKAAAMRQEQMAKLHADQRKAIEGTIAALQTELETYGMSAKQLDEYNLKKQNATAADLERAAAIRDQLDALDQEKKANEEAARAEEERFKEAMKNIEEIGKRRQEAAEAIAEFIAARDAASADAMASRERAETPGIAQFGSQEVFTRIAEMSNATEKIDKEALEESRKQTKLLADLVKKVGGDSEIQEVVFP